VTFARHIVAADRKGKVDIGSVALEWKMPGIGPIAFVRQKTKLWDKGGHRLEVQILESSKLLSQTKAGKGMPDLRANGTRRIGFDASRSGVNAMLVRTTLAG
jgi:hypothetical protein